MRLPPPPLRIGIDTLFEDPLNGSSAIDYLVSLIEGLARADSYDEFFVFTSPLSRSLFEHVNQSNFTYVNCRVSNERRALRILSQQALEPFLGRKYRLDVFLAPGNTAPLAMPCPCVLKINTFHHYHTPRDIGRTRALYRRFMVSASARRSERIIANSNSTRYDVLRFLKVPEQRVIVIPEAVDPTYTSESDHAALASRLQHGLGLQAGYLLFVSALYRYKNADGLIRAYSRLDTTVPLVVAGSDPDRVLTDLQSLVVQLGLVDRVIFLGKVPASLMPDLYRGASVLVYPSFSETFGKPLVEAMRCGTPVVASGVGPIPEILDGAGVIVDPADELSIADGVRSVLEDPALRQRLISLGLARGAMFSWDEVVRETLRVCREVALDGRTRTSDAEREGRSSDDRRGPDGFGA